MTEWFLRYGLQDGFVHNWLIAGPCRSPKKIGNSDCLGAKT